MGAIVYFLEISVSLTSMISRISHPLREGVLPEAPSFLPSAGALSLKAWNQIKEDVSSIPGDSFLGVWREKEGDNDRIDASLVHVCDQCF